MPAALKFQSISMSFNEGKVPWTFAAPLELRAQNPEATHQKSPRACVGPTALNAYGMQSAQHAYFAIPDMLEMPIKIESNS